MDGSIFNPGRFSSAAFFSARGAGAASFSRGLAAARTSCLSAFIAGIALVGVTPAGAQPACRPTLAFSEVRFSPMRPPTLERTWTAVVSVDASRCAANSRGAFEIGFSRLKETGPDMDFRERFIWLPPAVNVSVDFRADEAVERYWFDNIASCPCAQGTTGQRAK